MLLTLLFLVGCAAAPPQPAPPRWPEEFPTPEQLFEGHLAAIGGREAVLAQRVRAVDGRILLDGAKGIFLATRPSPDQLHILAAFPNGLFLEEGFDGQAGWARDPTGRRLHHDALEGLARRADLHRDANWRDWVAETEGPYPSSCDEGSRAERRCWRLEVTWTDHRRSELFFEVETGLQVASWNHPTGDGAPTRVEERRWVWFEGVRTSTHTVASSDTGVTETFIEALSGYAEGGEVMLPQDLRPVSRTVSVPLTNAGGFLTLPVAVDGVLTPALFDTGSSVHTLDAALSAVEGLNTGGEGVGGVVEGLALAPLPPLALGDWTLPEGGGVLTGDRFVPLGADLLLGAAPLSLGRVTLDLVDNRLRIEPPGGPVPEDAAPMRLGEGGLPEIEVTVGSRKMWALVDTGAPRTVLNWMAAAALGRAIGDPEVGRAGDLVGVGGFPVPAHAATVSGLAIGARPLPEAELLFALPPVLQRRFGSQPAALLGLDLLWGKVLVMDAFAGRAWIER
ncbi:MAG: retropepsin-like domain-containing protein [Alphaproteobacteria bacterium]|nr:retropepsin-like domain-containing protein [Alphaproteobacteria bacterium]